LNSISFTPQILTWYQENKRDLPWRQAIDPYRIWLSEVILQQTRVAQGLPYYQKFVDSYPTVSDLANATEEEVLRTWQGLGYYSRARNLHKCAKVIDQEQNGSFPNSFEELKKLPGIGNYTAAAIASIAFKEPVAVVDGNVYRLLARYFGLDVDLSSSGAYREFYNLAMDQLGSADPGAFNQAMMEFGALQCTPKNPDCSICPLSDSCFANASNMQMKLPVKSKKTKVRDRFFYYFLLISDGKILMRARKTKDIWQGLYELFLIETTTKQELESLNHPFVKQILDADIIIQVEDKIIRHALSHQLLNVNFAVVKLMDTKGFELEGYKWYSLEEVEQLPKPVLISNYLDTYLNSIHLQ
jgi:A/G-specific adenine glycosylase